MNDRLIVVRERGKGGKRTMLVMVMVMVIMIMMLDILVMIIRGGGSHLCAASSAPSRPFYTNCADRVVLVVSPPPDDRSCGVWLGGPGRRRS
jgi:hypothetical protein